MEEKTCLRCGDPHARARSSFCSQSCSRSHKQETVPKECQVCSKEYFSRGRTCSPEHALELKKRTNREKFGTDWAIQNPEAKARRVETNLKVYGETHHLKTKESLEKLRKTNRERYGVDFVGQADDFKEKAKATNLERYGAENVFQSEEIKEKIKNSLRSAFDVEYAGQIPAAKEKAKRTNAERYGAENPFASESVKERMRLKHLEQYQVEYPAQRDEVKEKTRETNISRYGHGTPLQNEVVKEKIKTSNLKNRGVEYPSQSPDVMAKIRDSYQRGLEDGSISLNGRVSKLNRRFAEEIKRNFGSRVTLEYNAGDYSFDLMVDEKIFIELNPTVTHSVDISYGCLRSNCQESPCLKHKPVTRDLHYKKALYARANGFKLIQFYDWEMENSLRLLRGRLMPNFRKTSARKLKVMRISQKEANLFLKVNHPQGAVTGQEFCFGLFEKEELLAVATFGKARFGAKESHEWLRYAVKDGHIIHGGPGLLFKTFLGTVKPTSVISYVDFNHTTSPLTFLNSVGFSEDKPTGPSCHWYNVREKKVVKNTSLLAQGAGRLLNKDYGSREETGLNNEAIMKLEGYVRVFTAGNRVFRWSSE